MLYVSKVRKLCIVCHRIADMPDPKVPSVQQRCALCHGPIWVSKKAAVDWPKVCLPCVRHGGEAMRRSKSKQQRRRDRRQHVH
jgi:hypothetical protein